ncbi:MAG: hypothetical protein PF637_13715 [Spirochaetes bacterium]|jgi:hypothetical protein|nr:hypothetical protein [Spirochaetota bacterium]
MDNSDKNNYYVEPVEIEIYLKKAGTVKTIIKDLYIELVDEEPKPDLAKKIFSFFNEKDHPIDLIQLQNNFPETILSVIESYYRFIDLYEKLSMHFRSALAGSIDSLRQALYMTELLMKYEPTLCSLQHIGDFSTYNLNYLIRKLNQENEEFLLEDSTVEYLIKRHRVKHEGIESSEDKEFEKLVELWQYNLKEKPII